MSLITNTAVSSETPARAYRRAHAGKLMLVEPTAGRELSSSNFFRLEEVSTHPTGLFVTGLFDSAKRNHMMASAVRDATEDEIAWHDDSGFDVSQTDI
jgi:hypothetical protein